MGRGAERLRAELERVQREHAERTRADLERLARSRTGHVIRVLVEAREDPVDAGLGFLADLIAKRKA